MLISTGIPSKEDIEKVKPNIERLKKGPAVMIECFQNIPCNPCVASCRQGAITMAEDINSLPEVDFEKCTGCGACVTRCPGLAIFIIDKTFNEKFALVKLPFEYLPIPQVGEYACGLNRAGENMGWFRVNKVISGGKKNMTNVISLEVPHELCMEVRNIRDGGYKNEK
jgi:Fe-S-cluster-containing hydrogenase component 2